MNILKPLETKTLSDNNELFITMTLEGSTNRAVLVLKLPSKSGKENLNFENLFYVVKYSKAGTVKELNFNKDIIFTPLSDNDKVKISLNGKYIKQSVFKNDINIICVLSFQI